MPSLRHQIDLGETGTRTWGSRTDIAVSPDGRYIVFTEYDRPFLHLWLKDRRSFDEPTKIVTADMNSETGYPEFSEDGQWIYYHDDYALLRVKLQGGLPEIVLPESVAPSGVTIRDDKVIFSDQRDNHLKSFDLRTEIVEPIEVSNGASTAYTWPQFIKGTNRILVTRGHRGAYANSSVDVIDLDTGTLSVIVPVAYHGRFLTSGHVLFVRNGILWAQPVDTESWENSSNPFMVLDDIETYEQFGTAGFAFSDSGELIYTPGSLNEGSEETRMPIFIDRNGTEQNLDIESKFYYWPQLDPSGKFLSLSEFSSTEGGSDIWLVSLDSQTARKMTFNTFSMRQMWADNGQEIIYRCSPESICSVNINGTEAPITLVSGLRLPTPYAQISDSKLIVGVGDPEEFFILSFDQKLESKLAKLDLGPSNSDVRSVRLSPDRNWLAYTSNESGRNEVYMRPFPDIDAGKWQVSSLGGDYPIWNKANNELFWWSLETDQIMGVNFNNMTETNETFDFSNPSPILPVPYKTKPSSYVTHDYNSANGSFVFVMPPTANIGNATLDRRTELKVIQSFQDELVNRSFM